MRRLCSGVVLKEFVCLLCNNGIEVGGSPSCCCFCTKDVLLSRLCRVTTKPCQWRPPGVGKWEGDLLQMLAGVVKVFVQRQSLSVVGIRAF